MRVDEVLQALETQKEGLTEEVARKRLALFGRNELAEKKRTTGVQILLQQFRDIFVLMLIAASLISAYLGEAVDAVTILVILILMAVVGFAQDYRGEKALEAMKRMSALTARILRDGKESSVPATDVVPGDVLLLEEGGKIAADGRLLEIAELTTIEAPLTGESTPVEKNPEPVSEATPVADRRDMVFYGTFVGHGRGRAIVTSTGARTEFGKIATQLQETKESKTPLQVKMDRFSRSIAKVVVAASALIFVLQLMRNNLGSLQSAIAQSLITSVSLAISAVPEGIPAITAVTLALGARALMRRNAIIRKLSSAETLGSVTVICSDKTGTLTKGEMTVRRIFVDDKFVDVTGAGYGKEGHFKRDGSIEKTRDKGLDLILKIGALCNNAKIEPQDDSNWKVFGDPTEGALIIAAHKGGMIKEELESELPRVKEIPFSSETKIMVTVHRSSSGENVAYVKGAPEFVLARSSHVHAESGELPITETKREELLAVNEEMASEALRVLGFAYKMLNFDWERVPEEIGDNLVFVGFQGMIDPPRPEGIEAFRQCERAGIRVVMITGDHKHTASAIASEIGILQEGDLVLTGSQLEGMGEAEFSEVVENVSVYARVSPAHKQRIVKALKGKGHIVAMTGDGVNDAPAIKQADIGIAMGITGTDVTKEASHMVLADDNFASIVSAVEYGRVIFDNIRKYTRFLIACNFDELILLASFALVGLPMPMLPSMILWINLATDGGPAIALSTDPPEGDVMSRPPRNPREGILHGMISFVLIAFVMQVLGSIAIFFYATQQYVFAGASIPENVLTKARTYVFIQSVLYELFIVWNCRSERRSLWRARILDNKYLIISVVGAFLATASLLYVPFLQEAFRVTPLSPSDWLPILVAASPGLLVLPEVFYGRKILRWR